MGISLLKCKQIIVVKNIDGNTENNRNILMKTFYAGGLQNVLWGSDIWVEMQNRGKLEAITKEIYSTYS